MLKEGNQADQDLERTEYLTELEEGERVIGHVWRENELNEDFDVQFILGRLD